MAIYIPSTHGSFVFQTAAPELAFAANLQQRFFYVDGHSSLHGNPLLSVNETKPYYTVCTFYYHSCGVCSISKTGPCEPSQTGCTLVVS